MDDFGDVRQRTWCIHCGSTAKGSDDHVPSRVFLDEPYPAHLPKVDICAACNQHFSLDEEYLACFLECVVCGTTNPDLLDRPKIKNILKTREKLRFRIENAKETEKTEDQETIVWIPEFQRIKNVALKLMKGHALYELNEPVFDEPANLFISPLSLMSERETAWFEAMPFEESSAALFPEIGSRAMQRLLTGADMEDGWIVVQPGRYRYQTIRQGSIVIKAIIREYLAVAAEWEA